MKTVHAFVLACFFGAAAAGPAGAADAAAPEALAPDVLVKNVTLEVVELVAKDREIRSGNRDKLMQLIEAKVLPHFNFHDMTALAMGRSWNKANPDQRRRIAEQFKTLLVRTYASALAAYSEQKFDFRPLRAKPEDTDVTVHVRVIQPGSQPVPIDYAMEKTAAGWKVYDVMVGGVSLLLNYRSEFNRTVRESGVEGLIKSLEQKNHSLAGGAAAKAK